MMFYFIREGDNELGPFTANQLKIRSIKKDTPVWFAGIQEWTRAGLVYELKELFELKPPAQVFATGKTKVHWNYRLLKQQFKKLAVNLF